MGVILVISIAAAVVWGLVAARHCSLLTGCICFVVVGCVLGHNFWHARVGPLTLTTDRILLVALCGLLAWRYKSGQVQLRSPAGSDWFVALLLGYLTVHCLLTPRAEGVATSVSPSWRLIASFWIPAALYWIASQAELSERIWKTMLGWLVVLGGYLALTGLAEVSEQWWAVLPRYIADPDLGTHFGRARGPLLTSVSLGMFLTVCFWAGWFLWSRVGKLWRAPLSLVMLMMVVGVYLSYTRSTWLGLAVVAVVVPMSYLPRQWRLPTAAGLLLIGSVGAMLFGNQAVSLARNDGSAGHSVSQRASFAYVSARMFRDQPLLGCGFGRFFDKKLPYLADRSQQLELESLRDLAHHNTYLSLLTETGLIGFGLFLAVLVAWGRAAWRLAYDPQQAVWVRAQGLFALAVWLNYVTNAMFHDLTLVPSEQWLLCLTAGISVGLQTATPARQDVAAEMPNLFPKVSTGGSLALPSC